MPKPIRRITEQIHLSTTYKTAIDNAMELKNRRHTMTFTSGSLSNQLSCAVDAIAKGVSRCASVVYIGEGDWDGTVTDNDATQSSLFEGPFLTQSMMHHFKFGWMIWVNPL